jgi:hypothetical protein
MNGMKNSHLRLQPSDESEANIDAIRPCPIHVFVTIEIFGSLLTGFLSKANANTIGIAPRIVNRIIPGIRKFWKGEWSNIDKGIPNNLPDGEMINTPPPHKAPNPYKADKSNSTFLEVCVFIIASKF